MKQYKIWTVVTEQNKDKVIGMLLDVPHLLGKPHMDMKIYAEEIEVIE